MSYHCLHGLLGVLPRFQLEGSLPKVWIQLSLLLPAQQATAARLVDAIVPGCFVEADLALAYLLQDLSGARARDEDAGMHPSHGTTSQ